MITSAGAANVYDLDSDASVGLFSLPVASTYDVMPLDITASDLASYLGANSPIYRLIDSLFDDLSSGLGFGSISPSNYSIAWWLDLIVDKFGLPSSGSKSTFYGFLYSLSEEFALNELGLNRQDSPTYSLGYYLRIISDSLGTRDVNPPVYSLAYYLKSLISAVNDTTTAVNGTTSAVIDFSSLFSSLVNSDLGPFAISNPTMLAYDGFDFTYSQLIKLDQIVIHGFRGIGSLLRFNSGYSVLDSTGKSYTLTSQTSLAAVLRLGFLGIRSLIAGSETDNVYSGSLIDNQNLTSNFSATGLGPMLNGYLREIQNDSGLLTYIFASPEDLEMKENSSSSMSAINDSFIDPDSDTSVSVSDIGTLSSAAGSIESFGATGVTPELAFAQLGNDSIFEFFSQTTADNLDSRPSSYSLRDPAPQIVTNYYSESRTEFFNLIGEG